MDKVKKLDLDFIGTLLSVAQNTRHQYLNKKNEIHQRGKSMKQMEMVQVIFLYC